MKEEAEYYVSLSIAPSTRQTYNSGDKQYVNFIQLYRPSGLSSKLFPASEDVLVKFIVYLAKTIKHSSIKTYLSAVRHFHIRNGFELDFKKFLRLQMVLKGIKRSQGVSIKTRLPITIHHLQIFYYLLAIPTTSNHDSLMLWAAMSIAFFGFLRLGELTCNSKFSKNIHLTYNNVTFFPNMSNPQHISVFIKASKTDPFRTGQYITVGRTNHPVCPVMAMKEFFSVRNPSPGPLFRYSTGRPLTKASLTAETRLLLSLAGFNCTDYAGHSYRIGAATTAASINLPSWLIKVLGRWSSDCFERYVKVPNSVLSGVSAQLLKDI